MNKQVVTFQARITYEVNTKSPIVAAKKAYLEMVEAFPNVGEGSEDEKVMCVSLQIDQVLPMKEV